MKYTPHKYQERAINHIIEHPYCGLFLDMGLGKTSITLTAFYQLVADLEVSKALVVAPKRVAEGVWSSEAEKWDHLKWIRTSVITGTAKKRIEAVDSEADLYVISRDNVQWLVDFWKERKMWPYDMLIIDELSSFKNPQAKRFKALRKVRPLTRRVVGLTGTPSPNGLLDLWSQMYLIDMGERLGRFVTKYRSMYFYPAVSNGPVVYKWATRKGADEAIAKKIGDICLSMSAADYLTLPERIDIDTPVVLSDEDMQRYKEMERSQVLSLQDTDIVALNAAALMNKLMQYAGGAVYDEEGYAVTIHDAKVEMLRELVEQSGENVLVFYNYKHEAQRIMSALAEYEPRLFDGESVKEWNEGRIRVLLAHPASTAFGLNLQQGGRTVVWFGPQWNLELYQQANARLYRQGQTRAVKIYRLIAKGTVDERVMAAVEQKGSSQAALLEAVKETIKEYKL